MPTDKLPILDCKEEKKMCDHNDNDKRGGIGRRNFLKVSGSGVRSSLRLPMKSKT